MVPSIMVVESEIPDDMTLVEWKLSQQTPRISVIQKIKMAVRRVRP